MQAVEKLISARYRLSRVTWVGYSVREFPIE